MLTTLPLGQRYHDPALATKADDSQSASWLERPF